MANRSLITSVLDYGLVNSSTPAPGHECDSDTCTYYWIAIGTGALIGFVGLLIAILALLKCCGFRSAGVLGGSCAAACQSPDTERGSLFATAQSVGASGLGCLAKLAVFSLGGIAGGILGHMAFKAVSYCEEPYCK